MNRIGFEYGPRFRHLEDITADPNVCRASATVRANIPAASRYIIHPILIDQCMQLFSVAALNGLARKAEMGSLPSVLEGVDIRQGRPDYEIQVSLGERTGHTIAGEGVIKSGGQAVFSVKKVDFFAVGDLTKPSGEDHASRLIWKRDIDFIPKDDLSTATPGAKVEMIEMLDKVTALRILETARRIEHLEPKRGHLKKHKSWLLSRAAQLNDPMQWTNPLIEYSDWQNADPAERIAFFGRLRQRIQEGTNIYGLDILDTLRQFDIVQKLADSYVDIFEGKVEPIAVLMEGNMMQAGYDLIVSDTSAQFFSLIGHSKPGLKILEVGAGVGAGTARFLRRLHTPEGARLYSSYTFTDISSGFIAPAQERFKEYRGIDYAVIDITRDPREQGFLTDFYDLIIASNVVHATPKLRDSLACLNSLLVPGGRLFLQESCYDFQVTNYIFGLLPGWWLGEEDGRVDQPLVSVSRWESELKAAGFGDLDFVVHHPGGICVDMISTRPALPVQKGVINLLVGEAENEWVLDVAQSFSSEGYLVRWCSLDEPPPLNEDVIALLDLEGAFLYELSPEEFVKSKKFFLGHTGGRILWVTDPSQIICRDPHFGLIYGFLRAWREETGTPNTSVFEVESFNEAAVKALIDVYEKLNREASSDCADSEFALYNGAIHIGRYTSEETDDREPKAGEVEIDVKCIGINFRDLMIALGMMGNQDEMGVEGSGIVHAVGPGVSNVKPGDRVLFLAVGSFRTRHIVSAQRILLLPDTYSFEDAAGVGCVYATVINALCQNGKLEKGQSVLVHAGCGGIGLAAITICQQLGAEVYTTVGSEVKAKYLMDVFGLPRSRIFHSRDTSFYPDLIAATEGRGVDIVLNSLAGELLRASWKCVAAGGKMLEIGKRDFLGHSMLPMNHFLNQRSFMGIDVKDLFSNDPRISNDLMGELKQQLQCGRITPIRATTWFKATEISHAFKHMQSGNHIGKLVITMPDNPSSLPTRPTRKPFVFSSDKAYLLVGGLGGLGRSISTWMVERGARYLVYLSPTAGTSDNHKAFFHELAVQGCHSTAVAGTVTSIEDVREAIARSVKPIAGVYQLAVALKDSLLYNMSYDMWKEPIRPKVEGAWNLHHALIGTELEFFIMFGSLSSTVGSAGQTNYATANIFTNASARYRHSLGLPASVVDLGVMTDIGLVSRDQEMMDRLKGRTRHLLGELEMLSGLEVLIHHSRSKEPFQPLQNPNFLTLGIRHADRNAQLSKLVDDEQAPIAAPSEDDDLKAFVNNLDNNPRVLYNLETEQYLIKKLSHVMNPTLDVAESAQLAVDSLVAIETRVWARQRLGIEVTLPEITAAQSIGGLARLIIKGLEAKYANVLGKN